jgi:hypothetical protein
MLGIFTGDSQAHVTNCQILVTVPACLEILMLAPTLENTWKRRLSYVVLDEVHSIGEESGGSVWEHLLQLINCPYVALSATIGNPEEFYGWLKKSFKGKHVRLIEHNTRSTDLQYVMYHHEQQVILHSTLDLLKQDLASIHPFSLLVDAIYSEELVRRLPPMLPAQMLSLWKHMQEEFGYLKDLNPDTFFPPDFCELSGEQLRQYDAALRDRYIELQKDNMHLEKLKKVSSALRKPIDAIYEEKHKISVQEQEDQLKRRILQLYLLQ